MSVDKRVKYDVQGGVKNYLGKQKEVKAPIKWQSSPDHPKTELAYITEAEKDLLVKRDLHGSLKGGVNRGPSGIMSLNGWGSADPGQNVSGAAASAAESGAGMGNRDVAASGMSAQDARDFRSAAINAGAGQRVNPGFFDSTHVVSPEELAAAKQARNNPTRDTRFGKGAWNQTRGSGLSGFISGGGITGGIIRGLGQMFGLGKKYNEPTYDMSKYNQLGYYPDRVKGYTRPEGYEFLDNEEQAAIDLELFNKGMYTDDYKDMYGLGMDDDGGITTIPTEGGDNYTELVEKYVPKNPAIPDNAFKSRFLQNRTEEEREAIEKMINEKFKYDYNSFGLGDMDGS